MKFKLTITGLDCPNCAAKLAELISAKDGVEEAKINFLTEKLTVVSSLSEDEVIALAQNTADSFEDGITIGK